MAALQGDGPEPGVSGYVLTPDGAPVAAGIVTLQAQGAEVTALIERTGRFRLVPHTPGPHVMHVGVPDLAPYRAAVIVPPSKTMTLPAIRLSAGTYFRVRLVSPIGAPIVAPHIVRESYDVSGTMILIPSVSRRADHTEPDGTTTIGPLPRGVTTLALDTPPFARKRLPDVQITGESPLVDGGTVNVEPGAVLHVDVTDGAGAPLPAHEVYLEDAAPFSPLMFQPTRTDQAGRVTFDRLASGRYRLRTRAAGSCGEGRVTIARAVSVSGSGTFRSRLVVGGNAAFRITSSGVPLTATTIIATPESAPSGPPPWLRSPQSLSLLFRRSFVPYLYESPCVATTDSDGRVRMTSFPPGSTRIDVRLPTSTWVRRLNVPVNGHEVAIEVPGGFLPVRVSDAATGGLVASAAITWTAGGARVEAATSVSGEALLGAAGSAPGTLAIRAAGYRPVEIKLREPPGVLHEVAIAPLRMNLQCRVVTASGDPVRAAVVEVIPENPMEVRHVIVTNEKGIAFIAIGGALRLRAHADGYVASEVRVPADATSDPVVTIARGHRVIARVDSLAGAGPSLIRIVNESGAAVDDLLDAASDRSIEAPGRVSLGPLPPGLYTIELRGPDGHKREPFHIENRDVSVTFR